MAFLIEPSWLAVLVSALTIVALRLFIKWCHQVRRLTPGTRLPPCLPSIPIVGSLPFMTSDPTVTPRFLMDKTAKYGNVFALYLGSRYAVVLNGYDTMKETLLKKSVDFAGRVPFFAFNVINPNRKGIAAANYDDEFRRKHQLHLSILKEFGFGKRLMETRINVEVAEFISQVRLIHGEPFDPKLLIHSCVINVIGSILLGRRYPSGHPNLVELQVRLQTFTKSMVTELELFPVLQFVPPFRGRLRKFHEAMRSVVDIIQREIKITLWDADHEQGERNDSFVRRWVESKAKDGHVVSLSSVNYDPEELQVSVTELFGAGEDTAASSLLWMFVQLANNPDLQTRLHEELESVVGPERLPLLDDEPRLPYLQAVILELLRHTSIAPLALWRETTCDTVVGDYFIGKSSLVIANLYSVHMDPALWSEPEIFRPERFLDNEGKIINKNNVVAFSLGKRSCLGESLARQELFLFLAGIVQNFKILPPEGQTVINAVPRWSIAMEPSSFCIRMLPRQR